MAVRYHLGRPKDTLRSRPLRSCTKKLIVNPFDDLSQSKSVLRHIPAFLAQRDSRVSLASHQFTELCIAYSQKLYGFRLNHNPRWVSYT